MKKILRESLQLLFAGQIEATIWGSGGKLDTLLSYDDFSALRPTVGGSSWRGAMAKAVELRYVVKRLKKGKTAFMLTRLGQEYLKRDFSGLQRVGDASIYSLMLLKPSRGIAPGSYARVHKKIHENRGVGILPSVFLFPTKEVSAVLLQELNQLGFLCCSFPIDSDKTHPALITDWLFSHSSQMQDIRHFQRISSQVTSLIDEIKVKKVLHKATKGKIGGLILSGMSILRELAWFETKDEQILQETEVLLRSIDHIMQEYSLKD